VGFTNILEACRHGSVAHLTYASTSSVYGANTKMPFSEHDGVDHPLQFYAATKRANELMAHSYSHLFGLPTTGLRFFTVYGPWGRPDMALFKFTRNILAGEPIDVFNYGNHTRDFTYIDDIVEGVIRASDAPAAPDPSWDAAAPDPATSNAPFRVFNIGNSDPVRLGDYIDALEDALGRKAIRNLLPLQPGDLPDTFSNSSELMNAIGYMPKTPIREGVRKFVDWYRERFDILSSEVV
jgi:UDP-glucuronate 4-epimerase